METAEPHAWVGGRVYTGVRWAEALLAEDGQISALGSDSDVRHQAPTGTAITELRGRVLIPGLIDSHLHWLGSVVDASGVDLRGCRSVTELQARLAEAAQRHPMGPLLGAGWDQEQFSEARFPNRSDLDSIEATRPVVLQRVCHHAAVVNSRVLDEMGVIATSPDPPGGRFGRDSSGEPDGLLFDRALQGLRTLSRDAFDSRSAEASAFLGRLAGRGLTTIGVMSGVAGEFRMAQELAARGPLPTRLRFYLLADEWDGQPATVSSSHDGPRVTGLKFVLDGSLGARTAWLDAPYSDAPGEQGISLTTSEEMTEWLERAARHRLGVALHAIGDRAVREAVHLLQKASPGLAPPRIEHASVLSAELVDRMAELRPVLVVQPQFVASDVWISERLGFERARWAYPFRTLLDRGLDVAGSSDAPVEDWDPWKGMATAVNRCHLTADEAIGMYTRAGAVALNEPGIGSLEVGARADAVLLESRSLEDAIARGGPVVTTWTAGRVTGRGGAPQRR